ncbi:histidine ammonia-lyase [Falsiporphyromonas endometrii]|uniref:Histidine ammonia-lyase n=1 Tax=Falsiporphyromonas endometrii TaxID=1387297 RepID=A0ABV9K9H1_9PORP|nr:histidine ammonia-lyase [Porphyromonadaceae bacterium]
MAKKVYEVGAQDLTLDILEQFLNEGFDLKLSQEAVKRIEHCRNYLDNKVKESDKPIYGVTTGFGSLCNRNISAEDLTTLQENLVKSHSCSCGNEVNKDIIRLMLLLKAHALSIGNSGVQVVTVERILDFLNNDALPVVYDRGSLGASGDLAPLANLFLPLIGEGEMYFKGEKRDSKDVLKELGLSTITLKSKEGLALLNGTQFMSSHGVYALLKARRLANVADYMAALSLDAFDGLDAPFDDRLHTIRPHKGQLTVARHMKALLKDSEQIAKPKSQVQDPYSFRCVPQVHGASRDAIDYVTSVVVTEINSVTDNPTVFPDDDMVVSGGNFHGQPLALVYDFLAIALSEFGNISERRVAQLIFGLRGLPEFLVAKPGLNSGFMIPQYAAAAMVSQNKMYCHSAASDSIVSSNGQEDHVSMGANAATKLIPLIENVERIFGIELLNASQAFEFRRPTKTSPILEKMLAAFRKEVPMVENDIVMYKAIQKATKFVQTYEF